MNRPWIAVLLAGGLGKRMQSSVPKVLHPILGEPMIVRLLKEVLHLGPERTLIVVNPTTYVAIQTAIHQLILPELLGHIEYVVQTEPRGTGHAIQCCVPILQTSPNHTVLILSGDVPLLRREIMRPMLDRANLAIIATTFMDHPHGYGRICTDAKGLFCNIVEEADCSEEERCIQQVNCGLYAFESRALCRYIGHLEPTNAQGEYYLTDVLQLLRQGEGNVIDLFTIPRRLQYQCLGVNTLEQAAQIERLALLDPIPEPCV